MHREGGDTRAALLDASGPTPAAKWCCGRDVRCVFVFADPQLERDYQYYLISSRRCFIWFCAAAAAGFSLDRVVFTALMMSDTLHQDASVNASAFVPFYALKLTSELLSLALSATAAVAVQFSSLRKKWDIVSKLETTMFAGVLLPLVVITSAVGYNLSSGLVLDISNNVTQADLEAVALKLRIEQSISQNSNMLAIAPLMILIFSPPARWLSIMMWIIIVFALVPNAILPGLLGTAAILEYNTSALLEADMLSTSLQFVWTATIVLVVCVRLALNFDATVRSTFLLRHLVEQERDDLSSLANPFAPQQLEKWYSDKQRSFLMKTSPSQRSRSSHNIVRTEALDNQPWDLRCEDIELESTIAAGGAGSVIAATYNGFDVAVKVLHSSTVDHATLLELSREVSALHRIRHGYIVQFYGLTILRQDYDGAIAIVTER
eukprot:INCI15815.2.p1 GENE.INCI15815.2~~INCI15815.2.p1  ORF type:complete len:435 (+),score=62.54 INCI15815.2:203-1507(+)